MNRLVELLSGGDRRSIGNSNAIASGIKDQKDFDELGRCLYHEDRIVVMRAADAIEKTTVHLPHLLFNHTKQILTLCDSAVEKELMWHLALLLPRLPLRGTEAARAAATLTKWAKDGENSRIVRVNSLQGLFEMTKQDRRFDADLRSTLLALEKDNIPSLTARIRSIRKQIGVWVRAQSARHPGE